MDIVQRLIVVALLLMSGLAYADEYTPTYKWRSSAYSGFFPERDTYQEVLEDNKTKLNENGANYQLISTVVLNASYVSGNYSEGGATFQRGAERVAYCNYGGSLTGSGSENNQKCINAPSCPDGQQRQPDGSCKEGCESRTGQVARSGLFEMGTSTRVFKTTGCLNQCMLRFDGDIPGKQQLVNGKYHYFAEGSFIYNGFSCEGGTGDAPPNSTQLPPPSCGSGQVMGQFNGVNTCVGAGDGKPVNPHTPEQTEKTDKTKTENPDGSTTETQTTTRADGSSTTITTITNPDGSSTTTRTETPATGAGGAVSGGAKPDGNNDNDNDNDNDQEESKSSWSGSCGAFQCEGDAVNCAIARKIHQDRCDDKNDLEKFEPAAEEGRRILMGEDDEAVQGFLNKDSEHKRTINLANEIKETGDYQFAAQCISDVQFSIGGHVISVPFSKLCPYFEMIGYILLAASYLYALRIVGIW